jgi:hypothetical protein
MLNVSSNIGRSIARCPMSDEPLSPLDSRTSSCTAPGQPPAIVVLGKWIAEHLALGLLESLSERAALPSTSLELLRKLRGRESMSQGQFAINCPVATCRTPFTPYSTITSARTFRSKRRRANLSGRLCCDGRDDPACTQAVQIIGPVGAPHAASVSAHSNGTDRRVDCSADELACT